MKNAILVHGWNTHAEFFDSTRPTASNDHWFPWLTKQLMVRGYKVDAPEMTQYDQSTYESWKREFERFDITPDTLLVGHSCGGGFLVRYLTEHDIKVGRVILVAPWLGIKGTDLQDEPFDENFFAFTPERTLAAKTAGLHLLVSDDDFADIHQSVAILRDAVDDMQITEFTGKGHFTLGSLGTEEFPELLDFCTCR
jgi:predicted alpha/beta hydrolase family esterase